jgi:hypothetical protein
MVQVQVGALMPNGHVPPNAPNALALSGVLRRVGGLMGQPEQALAKLTSVAGIRWV